MQIKQHKTTTKVSKIALQSVWKPNNGQFDDGIDIVRPESEAKLEKFGPHIRFLMQQNNVSEDDITKNFCIDCGKEHNRRVRRCLECSKIHTAKGLNIKQ